MANIKTALEDGRLNGRIAYLDPQADKPYGWGDLSDTEDGAVEVLLIDHASRSDYGDSSPVSRANLEALEQDFPESVFTVGFSSHDGIQALVRTGDRDDYLLDILLGLQDYPLYDGDALHEVEQEILEETWRLWLEDELIDAMDPELMKHAEDEYEWAESVLQELLLKRGYSLRHLFHEAMEVLNLEVEYETSESCFVDSLYDVGVYIMELLTTEYVPAIKGQEALAI